MPRGPVQVPHGGVFTVLGRTILDRLDRGVVLLDAQGRIVDANSHTLQIIRNCSGIRLRAGRLAFTDPELDDRMQQAIAGHAPAQRGGRSGTGSSTCRCATTPSPPTGSARSTSAGG